VHLILLSKKEGLPQMTVRYDRSKIRYSLNIAELNDMIALGFAGKTVGNVLKEKNVLIWSFRLNQANRQGIDDLKICMLPL
jgi:cobalt-zinc-cadmium resistance protein CzcA